ncbi:MAG: DNA repair protein RadA [Candidatus Saccharimonadales bacterium]
MWSGKCYSCGEWNTLEQQIKLSKNLKIRNGKKLEILSIETSISNDNRRYISGTNEIDQVFGGGLVAGSVNLIAGQPGIGKSTLLLQFAYLLSKQYKVLYVSAEESIHQIGIRANRLGANIGNLKLSTSNFTDEIAATIVEGQFNVVIVDSIQTVTVEGVASASGTVSQITNSTHMLTAAAKKSNTAVILVGHVTKEGSIAGPKILEHLVDVVLQLEGDRYGGFKVLRAIKNRFGSTNETGIFEMKNNGLYPVDNPSATLLAERQITDGSVVLATLEGTRPLLVEVQALVNKTSYGYPKRAASGVDINRVNLLIAMMEKRTKINLSDKDIYINIVGGIKLKEPAADLALCMAVASAAMNFKLSKNAVIFGEVGLSGEIRHVSHIDKRIAEAQKLGFEAVIGPVFKSDIKYDYYFGMNDIKKSLNTFLK